MQRAEVRSGGFKIEHHFGVFSIFATLQLIFNIECMICMIMCTNEQLWESQSFIFAQCGGVNINQRNGLHSIDVLFVF